jgi:hypothetical protein
MDAQGFTSLQKTSELSAFAQLLFNHGINFTFFLAGKLEKSWLGGICVKRKMSIKKQYLLFKAPAKFTNDQMKK